MHAKVFFHICSDPEKPDEGEYLEYSSEYETVGELLEFQNKVNEAVIQQVRSMPAADHGLVGEMHFGEPIINPAGHDGTA